jgi:hypothetical protein
MRIEEVFKVCLDEVRKHNQATPSRELSIVSTKIEEALMWLGKYHEEDAHLPIDLPATPEKSFYVSQPVDVQLSVLLMSGISVPVESVVETASGASAFRTRVVSHNGPNVTIQLPDRNLMVDQAYVEAVSK